MATFNPEKKATEFVVKVSAANMPNSCWGRYANVAVLEVVVGETPVQIRDTRKVRVVWVWRKLNCGTTDKCAKAKALREAEEMVEKLEAERESTMKLFGCDPAENDPDFADGMTAERAREIREALEKTREADEAAIKEAFAPFFVDCEEPAP